jgi:hypothetical protein
MVKNFSRLNKLFNQNQSLINKTYQLDKIIVQKVFLNFFYVLTKNLNINQIYKLNKMR